VIGDLSGASDAALVIAVARWQEEALAEIYRRHGGAVFGPDVLGYHSAEVADMLESTEDSVKSALKRARAALDGRLQASRQREPAPLPRSSAEEALVERFTNAFVAGDVAAVVALLTRTSSSQCPRSRWSTTGASWSLISTRR
jgi:hypothetical protein